MNFRLLTLSAISFLYISAFFLLDNWKTLHAGGDDTGYYLHVLSFWKNNDVGNYDRTLSSLIEKHPKAIGLVEDPYLIKPTETGKKYIKYTLGVGVMESPFFLLTDFYVKHFTEQPADGWSLPYYLAIRLSNVFYVFLGIWLLFSVLKEYFSEKIVAINLISIALATNLFYQTLMVTMAHGFLFFDYCLLLWLTTKFYKSPNWRLALSTGAVVGLISITRIPEIVSVFVPLLWGITYWAQFKSRISFFAQYYSYLLWAFLGFLLLFSIQLGYWYYVSGQILFNPYGEEGFNFLKPHIWGGFFDFKNGWLIYTPIMSLSLVGLFFLKKYKFSPLWAIVIFLLFHVYIHYSYYAWTYFPGLGSRPMVETYPLLSFGLAACLNKMAKKNWLKIGSYGLLTFFIWLNLFQTWQSKKGIIRSSRGSIPFYYETFATMHPNRNALRSFDLKIFQPDESKLRLEEVLIEKDFENSSIANQNIAHSGKGAYYLKKEDMFFPLSKSISLKNLPANSWLQVQIHAYFKTDDRIWNRERLAKLTLELWDEKGQKQIHENMTISSHIANADNSIWWTGEPNQWEAVTYYVKLPSAIKKGWTTKAYITNQGGQKLYLDDFRLACFVRSN